MYTFNFINSSLIILLNFISFCDAIIIKDLFYENLIAEPLKDTNDVLLLFNFSSIYSSFHNSNSNPDHSINFGTFPTGFGEIIYHFNISELHLIFSNTNRRKKLTEIPLIHKFSKTKSELIVFYFQTFLNVSYNTFDRKAFINSISSLTGSQFDQFDDLSTFVSNSLFIPFGEYMYSNDNLSFLYLSMPNLDICSNNLNSWLKLLPCQYHGLSSIINSNGISNGDIISLEIHFQPIYLYGFKHYQLELLLFSISKTNNLITNSNYFLLCDLIVCEFESFCPLSIEKDSVIKIIFERFHEWNAIISMKNLIKLKNLKNNLNFTDNLLTSSFHTGAYSVLRFSIGSSINFMMNCIKFSSFFNNSYLIASLDLFPNLFDNYYDTIINNLETPNSNIVISRRLFSGQDLENNSLDLVHFRTFPEISFSFNILKLFIPIPFNYSLSTCFHFKSYLHTFSRYNPDLHKGLFLPSILIDRFNFFRLNSIEIYSRTRLYCNPLLVSKMIPDFSMPYNVLCLVCTSIGIAFSFIHRTTVRSLNLKC